MYNMADNAALPGVCNVKRVYSIHMYSYNIHVRTMANDAAIPGVCSVTYVYSIHMCICHLLLYTLPDNVFNMHMYILHTCMCV